MPIIILGGGSQDNPDNVPGESGSAVFTAQTTQLASVSILFVAQSLGDPVTVDTDFGAQGMALPAGPLNPEAVIYTSVLSGFPGPVLSWDYTHSGDAEELSATVRGLFGLSAPTVTLSALARTRTGAMLGSLPPRAFSTFGQEPQEDVGQNQTTFRFKEGLGRELRGETLPELIPWKLSPTPDACLPVRQRVNISWLVRGVLGAYGVTLESDPLSGEYFVEGRSDFSTVGMTPQALWDATYGALGMVLVLDRNRDIVGRFVNPVSIQSGPEIPGNWVTTLTQGRELLQTPAQVTLKGGPAIKVLDTALLLAALGSDPSAEEVGRQLTMNQEWSEPVESAGTTRTQRGYLKSGGQMVSTLEITTDDVAVQEKNGEDTFFKLWSGVATGYKLTRTTYDPNCPTRPILQVTESKTWGFDAQTVEGTFYTYGPSLYRTLQVGDLVSDETSTTTYRYNEAGYQIGRTTSTRRLASLKQQDAEALPEDRGPLQSGEYITTTQTEQWQLIGPGRWLYTPGVSGQTLVAVYDAESGEAVRTASIARSAPDAPRVTDQAPPSFDCALCGLKELQDETGVLLKTGDAGFADPQEVALGFLSPDSLLSVARLILAQNWGRVVTSLTVPLPLGYFPGDWLTAGRVRELRISQSEGSPVITTNLTTVRPDDLLGSPGGASVQNYLLDKQTGRATMLAAKPGGALARIVVGWDAAGNAPLVENGFIAFRTGFPPSPGDEIDWRLVRGRREATGAR